MLETMATLTVAEFCFRVINVFVYTVWLNTRLKTAFYNQTDMTFAC